GLDQKLTVYSKVQTILDRELDNAVAKYHPDVMIAVAMNPKNGEILGMSIRPDFDPASYQSVDPYVYNRNLPVWSTDEAGSTFKIIT
ncbi:stage V sporulation protein D, partial [Bacillus vallismortis]|nr:stage V sporulation protein D [Bacillus vallismortis]